MLTTISNLYAHLFKSRKHTLMQKNLYVFGLVKKPQHFC